jgi:LacI family transcriptional regulator
VPQDLAIIAFDNSPIATLPLVDLTSVDQDGFGQGKLAAGLLLDRIAGRTEAAHLLVPPQLIKRSSS